MRIIAVDDERLALRSLAGAIDKAVPGGRVDSFTSPLDALAHARATPVDVAFLDIAMGGFDGIALAQELKHLNPKTNIIFVTGYSEYMPDAFSLYASGYVMKPAEPERIRREIENLRHQVAEAPEGRVQVRTFGGFEVRVDGRPLHITRAKPRELLAYLIHRRGAGITAAKVASILWEDRPYDRSLQAQTQTAISQLMKILREAGIGDIVVKKWNSLAVDPDAIRCDYYDFLEGDVRAINAYQGDYLEEYGWAEFTIARLDTEKEHRRGSGQDI